MNNAQDHIIYNNQKIYLNETRYTIDGRPYKILRELENSRYPSGKIKRTVEIQFIKTGFVDSVDLPYLISNKHPLLDRLEPSVFNKGCLGYAKSTDDVLLHSRWRHMISRCYNKKDDSYRYYGGNGVTVCDRWLRFDYFLEDAVKLPGYDDMVNNPNDKYELDKDIRCEGSKIYSPETCSWVNKLINLNKAHSSRQSSRTYFGVDKYNSGNYGCYININGNKFNIGTFDDEIAAANAFNYWAERYGNIARNNVQYMSPIEFIKHNTSLIILAKVVDKNNNINATNETLSIGFNINKFII